eukprot:3941175-Rhodomonas_salina.2
MPVLTETVPLQVRAEAEAGWPQRELPHCRVSLPRPAPRSVPRAPFCTLPSVSGGTDVAHGASGGGHAHWAVLTSRMARMGSGQACGAEHRAERVQDPAALCAEALQRRHQGPQEGREDEEAAGQGRGTDRGAGGYASGRWLPDWAQGVLKRAWGTEWGTGRDRRVLNGEGGRWRSLWR